MVIVGPEDPLLMVFTISFLNDAELKAYPRYRTTKKLRLTLEGSKDFAKKFMMRHHITNSCLRKFTAESLEKAIYF